MGQRCTGFYSGRVANAIASAVADQGGVLTTKDLESHKSAFVEPVSCVYRGHRVYETPPPTQACPILLRCTAAAPPACLAGALLACEA